MGRRVLGRRLGRWKRSDWATGAFLKEEPRTLALWWLRFSFRGKSGCCRPSAGVTLQVPSEKALKKEASVQTSRKQDGKIKRDNR